MTAITVVEFSPTTAPLATPVWENISERCYSVSMSRGRSAELAQFSAGTASYDLANHDRQLDPSYAAGDWFGNLKPRRRIRHSVIVGPILLAASGALFMVAVETDSSLTTHPVSVRAAEASPDIVMQDSAGQRWKLGVADDSSLTTTATTDPVANVPVLTDLAGVKWKIGVETDSTLTTTATSDAATGITARRFTGFINGYPQAYNPPGDATVTIEATDGFGLLARMKAASAWEQEVRATNPDRWFRLGESQGTEAQDSSGNGGHGVYQGGATFSDRDGLIAGDSDGSIEFDGVDDAVEFPDPIEPGDSFTVAFWCQIPEFAKQTAFVPYFYNAGGFGAAARSVWLEPSGVVRGSLADPDTVVESTTAVDDDRPHLVFFELDRSAGRTRIYVDSGAAEDTAVYATARVTGGETGYIGQFRTGSAQTEDELLGIMDEVLIWRRVLTSTERANLYAAGTDPWDEDLPGTRIGRLLDMAGWPAGDRDIDTGSALLGPFSSSGSILEALQEVARAEGGRSMLYINGEGKLVFRGRHDFWTGTAYTTSQATFGDGAGELVFDASKITIEHDDLDIVNRARIAPITGWFQQADDAGRGADDPIYEHEERIIEKRAVYARHAAEYIVARKKDDYDRLPMVVIDPDEDPDALYPVVLAADFGYRYTFKRRPQDIGDPIAIDVHLERVTENITPEAVSVSWQLSPAESAFWSLGSSTLGVDTRLAL